MEQCTQGSSCVLLSVHVQCIPWCNTSAHTLKCLRTLTRMSECMCDTVLPECHAENWVWLVLRAKASHSLFSIKPNRGGNSSRCNSSILGFHCSPLAFTFMNPAAILGCFRRKNQCSIAKSGHHPWIYGIGCFCWLSAVDLPCWHLKPTP